MPVEASRSALVDFARGMRGALTDDGRIGPNDAPALRELAERTPVPGLATFVDALEQPVQPVLVSGLGPSTPFATGVVVFTPGVGAGFNARSPRVVLGSPEGAGSLQGGLHVMSLGHGGSITVELGRPATQGIKVFENGFGSDHGTVVNPEPARVEVSADGVDWVALKGDAGLRAVRLNSINGIDPQSADAGGDAFSFADNGIAPGAQMRFVRITDLSTGTGASTSGTAGFDLDAVYGF